MKHVRMLVVMVAFVALSGCRPPTCQSRYAVISGADGKVYRVDAETGAVQLITPKGIVPVADGAAPKPSQVDEIAAWLKLPKFRTEDGAEFKLGADYEYLGGGVFRGIRREQPEEVIYYNADGTIRPPCPKDDPLGILAGNERCNRTPE